MAEMKQDDQHTTILITASYGSTLCWWNVEDAAWSVSKVKSSLNPMHDYAIAKIRVSEDGRLLAVASSVGLYLYNITEQEFTELAYIEQKSNVISVDFNRQGSWICFANENSQLCLHDIQRSSTEVLHTHSVELTCSCLHPNQCDVFFGDSRGVVRVLDLATKKTRDLFTGARDVSLRCLTVSPDGSFIGAGNDIGQLFFGAFPKEDNIFEYHEYKNHSNIVLSLRVSSSVKYVVTSSADTTLGVYEIANQIELRFLRLLHGHIGWVWDFEIHSDEKHIVSVSSDGFMNIWNIETQRLIKKIGPGDAKCEKCNKCDKKASPKGYVSMSLKA